MIVTLFTKKRNLYKALSVVYLAIALITPFQSVVAQDSDCNEAKLRNLQVSIIDCGTSCDTSSQTGSIYTDTTSLTGSDNIEKTFNFFKSKDLSNEQVAGILGNLIWESSVDPEKIQGGKRSQNPNDAGRGGWGLMQWTPGSKITGLLKNANITTPVYELGTQLELVWWHMNNTSPTGVKNFIEKYKTITTVEEATRDFEERMEGAGKPAINERIKLAKEAFQKYSGSFTESTSGNSSVGSSSCPSTSSGGGAGGYLLGDFVVYSQTDPLWKNTAYGTSTIGVSGCGPSAMAMIITALTGQKVTPVETSNYAASKGQQVPGSGSSWTIGPVVAKNWGLKSEPVGRDIGQISNALREGKLIITPGQGPKPFTSGGHFIVIRGVTESGKWLVGDSGHGNTSDQEWDPQLIVSNMRPGGSYAIYK